MCSTKSTKKSKKKAKGARKKPNTPTTKNSLDFISKVRNKIHSSFSRFDDFHLIIETLGWENAKQQLTDYYQNLGLISALCAGLVYSSIGQPGEQVVGNDNNLSVRVYVITGSISLILYLMEVVLAIMIDNTLKFISSGESLVRFVDTFSSILLWPSDIFLVGAHLLPLHFIALVCIYYSVFDAIVILLLCTVGGVWLLNIYHNFADFIKHEHHSRK
mmetsp:Transcript_32755/g.42037  ORF Transcript_32755/g.42037 Transcript_32755/m.42037 type:complete len:217 (-) Transcript_32755:69-719(-)